MDAVVAFIANGETTKPAEPGERALHDPAEHAKAAAVGRAATAEDRNNDAGGEAITMWLRIVATVALQDVGLSARPPERPRTAGKSATKASRWVMSLTFAAVTCATSGTPRASVTMWCLDPALRRSVGFGPVFPPRIARTDPLSTTAQRWSSRPRRRSSARRVSRKRRQAPARSHSTKRRQHVLPEPHPISRGNICHGNLPRSTTRMPVSAARSETLGRPPRRRARRRGFGSNGSRRATAHRPGGAVPCATVPSRPRK